MISKELLFWGIFALYVVLMVSQFIDYRKNPEDRAASFGTMAIATIVMVGFICALPHI